MKSTIIAAAVLIAAGIFFLVALRGYQYISYTLFFIAALVLINRFAPEGLRKAVLILVCIGLLYFCVVEIPIIGNSRTDPDCERGYLIVLGAAVRGDTPTLTLVHRLEGAKAYLEKYPKSKAVVCGGQGEGENISEAQCMYIWLCEHGIAPERIIREDRSTSTEENIRFARALIDSDGGDSVNIALLSSPYHLFRAKAIAAKQGCDPRGVACVFGLPVYTLCMYIREAFGVTHYIVFGK